MLSEPEATRFVTDHSMIKVMEKFDAAYDKLTNIIELQSHEQGQTTADAISDLSVSVAADPKAITALTMVGFDEDALHLKGRLISRRSAREIIPIVGMGGIGKTTLARNLYNDPLIASHFHVRAWVTVSQDYDVRAILLGLLGSISENNHDNMNCSNLGDTLYRRLHRQKYLVVLDDIWSGKAWDEIRRHIPDDNNGSRILITSRGLDVAKHVDSACEEHQMRLLSDAHSWDLLRQKVFERDEHCPPLFEIIGRRIASNCGGLPLAINVIGGLLSVDKHSKDLWYQVARDVRSILSHEDNHISEILSLSYDNLPLHLKPCFLYVSAFPEDFEVRHSKLVQLLVAEGFLSRKNGKSLEDVAEESLKALVDRNLLSVVSTRYDGRAESYNMHDLLRDICVGKAEEENFLHIFKYGNDNNFRRVSIHHLSFGLRDLAENLSRSRSLLFINPGYFLIDISSTLSTLRLTRVLDVYGVQFYEFPEEILKLANLRFLAVEFSGNLPSAVWKLRDLQTLQIHIFGSGDVTLPSEAWEISGLRHIILKNAATYIDFKVPRVHENLQTICRVDLHDLLASNIISNIPNVKELGISGFGFTSEDTIIDLSHLHKLESLKLWKCSVSVLSLLRLPDCLKKLSLLYCTLPMELLNAAGDLQYLQVLKIKGCTFHPKKRGKEEWEVNEGVEFCSLQFLSLQSLNLDRWKADYSQFPSLSHLKIRGCRYLKEIPACIGETLEMIEVRKNNRYQVGWANEVRETQRHEYGNEMLQIRLVQ